MDNKKTKEKMDSSQLYFFQFDRILEKLVDKGMGDKLSGEEILIGINGLWFAIPTNWKKKSEKLWSKIEEDNKIDPHDMKNARKQGNKQLYNKLQLIVDVLEKQSMWRKTYRVDGLDEGDYEFHL